MDDDVDPLMLGTGYALYRHGQDRLAAQIHRAVANALDAWEPNFDLGESVERAGDAGVVRTVNLRLVQPENLEDFRGQERLKRHVQLRIQAARKRYGRLPHALLTAPSSGMGRRSLARVMAVEMGVQLIELAPPFSISTLLDALALLGDKDILLIREIDTPLGDGVLDLLVRLAEEGALVVGNSYYPALGSVTLACTATDEQAIPGPLADRLAMRLRFDAYSWPASAEIACSLAFKHRSEELIDDELAVALALLGDGVPAVIEHLVLAARDLAVALDRAPTGQEVREFFGLGASDGQRETP